MIFYLRKNYVDNIVGYNAVAYLVFPYVNIMIEIYCKGWQENENKQM